MGRRLPLVLTLLLALLAGTTTAGQADPPPTERARGTSRIGTAVALSQLAFDTADVALLARADKHFDAVASAPLAAELDAPLLLTDRDVLPGEVAAELDRLGVSEVVILGGPGAVSEDVEVALAERGVTTRRVRGTSRFSTAAAVANEVVRLGGPVDQVLVAIGSHPNPARNLWADALAAGNLATRLRAPVLLTDGVTLSPETAQAIDRLGVARATIVGGTGAISSDVEADLEALGLQVDRLRGANRYSTGLAIVDRAREVADGDPVGVLVAASGADFPDALGGVVAAWKLGGVLVLVPPSLPLGEELEAWLPSVADANQRLVVAGGPGAVSDASVQRAQQLLDPLYDPPGPPGTSDEFNGSALDTGVWNVRRGDAADITVSGGSLHVEMTQQALWYNQQAGLLISQDVTGDFAVTARVLARRSSDPSRPPDQTVHLGGLAARDPASDTGPENYVFVVTGYDVNDLSTEWKTTVDDQSTFDGPFTGRSDAEVRICRVGQVFTLMERPVTGGAWTVLQVVDRAATRPLPQTLQVGAVAYTNSPPDLRVTFEEVVFDLPDQVACS